PSSYLSLYKPHASTLVYLSFFSLSRALSSTLFPYTTLFRSILVDPNYTYTGNVTVSAYSVSDVTGSLAPSAQGASATPSLTTPGERKSTRLNSSDGASAYVVLSG